MSAANSTREDLPDSITALELRKQGASDPVILPPATRSRKSAGDLSNASKLHGPLVLGTRGKPGPIQSAPATSASPRSPDRPPVARSRFPRMVIGSTGASCSLMLMQLDSQAIWSGRRPSHFQEVGLSMKAPVADVAPTMNDLRTGKQVAIRPRYTCCRHLVDDAVGRAVDGASSFSYRRQALRRLSIDTAENQRAFRRKRSPGSDSKIRAPGSARPRRDSGWLARTAR